MSQQKPCPHCGALLPEGASFCPHCARSVREHREEVSPPWHMPRRILYSILIVLLAAVLVLALSVWVQTRPKTYESDTGELLYTGRAGAYRLCLSRSDPPVPKPENHYHAVLDDPYRDPVPLYALDPDTGEPVTETFLLDVASVSAQISSPDKYVSVTCTEPQPSDYYPNAAAVTFVDFQLVAPGDYGAELVYTITMKNGDTLCLTQKEQYSSITVYQYTAQDEPMETIEELQALVDRVTAASDEYDQIYLYLPAVIYEGGLTMEGRCINLYGSVGPDGQRTAFLGPTQIASPRGVREFHDIHFLGSGQGTGVQALGASRLHLTGCRVSGWETGFLAEDRAWINADETVFTDNAVGMCFNAQDTPLVSDNFYSNNISQGNVTAILLERVSGDAILAFPGTVFTGNGTDIDNRCGLELDLSEAIFE